MDSQVEASLEAVYVDPRLNAAVRVHTTDATEEPVDFLADGLNDAEQDGMKVTVPRVGKRGYATDLAVHRDDVVQYLLNVIARVQWLGTPRPIKFSHIHRGLYHCYDGVALELEIRLKEFPVKNVVTPTRLSDRALQ